MTPAVILEAVDSKAPTDSALAAIHSVKSACQAERDPAYRGVPVSSTRARLALGSNHTRRSAWVATDPGGAPLGWAEADIYVKGESIDLVDMQLEVDPEHRGDGVGRALLAAVVHDARAAGKTTLFAYTSASLGVSTLANVDVGGGGDFAERFTFRFGVEERISDLVLADLEPGMIRRWIEEAPGRAPGYALEEYRTPVPADVFPDLAHVLLGMNDAPKGDLDIPDEIPNIAEMMANDADRHEHGIERRITCCRETTTGEMVAYSAVDWDPRVPWTGDQMATTVFAAHRGHALGKWVKAAMVERLGLERPEIERIRTGNAQSNDAMLGINMAMGFRPVFAYRWWQGDVAEVAAALAVDA